MESCRNNSHCRSTEEQICLQASRRHALISRLQRARERLDPIVDEVVFASLSTPEDHRSCCSLSAQQYGDVKDACSLLQEFERQNPNPSSEVFDLSNVGKEDSSIMRLKGGMAITVDEETVSELLALFKKLGECIERLTKEQVLKDSGKQLEPRDSFQLQRQRSSSKVKLVPTGTIIEDGPKAPIPESKTGLSLAQKIDDDDDDEDDKKEDKNSGTVYITIRCLADAEDTSDQAESGGDTNEDVDKRGPQVHVMVDGKPVPLTLDQKENPSDSVYCIDTGDPDKNIKIVIKNRPDPSPFPLSSSARSISEDPLLRRSLLLKRGLSTDQELDAEGDPTETKLTPKKSQIQRPPSVGSYYSCGSDPLESSASPARLPSADPLASPVRPAPSAPPASPVRPAPSAPPASPIIGNRKPVIPPGQKDSGESITLHGRPIGGGEEENVYSSEDEDKSKKAGGKVSVVLDPENIDRSTVKFKTDGGKTARKRPSILLTRDRVCSSMEFNVAEASTEMRQGGIQHENEAVKAKLNELGVNQLLRASRPAKCCRKAILDEKPRRALPYSASLRSLPLVNDDIAIIKQSVEMSLKKSKHAGAMNRDMVDKMAYYVSLGRDDIHSNINFPWVVPNYDIKLMELLSSSCALSEGEAQAGLKRTRSVEMNEDVETKKLRRNVKILWEGADQLCDVRRQFLEKLLQEKNTDYRDCCCQCSKTDLDRCGLLCDPHEKKLADNGRNINRGSEANDIKLLYTNDHFDVVPEVEKVVLKKKRKTKFKYYVNINDIEVTTLEAVPHQTEVTNCDVKKASSGIKFLDAKLDSESKLSSKTNRKLTKIKSIRADFKHVEYYSEAPVDISKVTNAKCSQAAPNRNLGDPKQVYFLNSISLQHDPPIIQKLGSDGLSEGAKQVEGGTVHTNYSSYDRYRKNDEWIRRRIHELAKKNLPPLPGIVGSSTNIKRQFPLVLQSAQLEEKDKVKEEVNLQVLSKKDGASSTKYLSTAGPVVTPLGPLQHKSNTPSAGTNFLCHGGIIGPVRKDPGIYNEVRIGQPFIRKSSDERDDRGHEETNGESKEPDRPTPVRGGSVVLPEVKEGKNLTQTCRKGDLTSRCYIPCDMGMKLCRDDKCCFWDS